MLVVAAELALADAGLENLPIGKRADAPHRSWADGNSPTHPKTKEVTGKA